MKCKKKKMNEWMNLHLAIIFESKLADYPYTASGHGATSESRHPVMAAWPYFRVIRCDDFDKPVGRSALTWLSRARVSRYSSARDNTNTIMAQNKVTESLQVAMWWFWHFSRQHGNELRLQLRLKVSQMVWVCRGTVLFEPLLCL